MDIVPAQQGPRPLRVALLFVGRGCVASVPLGLLRLDPTHLHPGFQLVGGQVVEMVGSVAQSLFLREFRSFSFWWPRLGTRCSVPPRTD